MLPGKSVINLQNELSDSPSVEIAASCIRRCILLEGEQENCDQLTLDHFLSDYASLVDDIKGINNYAAASLKLAEGTKNDSTRWRSSLQTDDLIHAVNEDRDDYKRIQDCQASEKPIGTQNIARLTDLLQKTLMLQFDIPPPTELEPNARQDQVSFKADSTWTASGNKVGLKRPLLPSSTQAGNLLDVKRTNAEQSNNNESRSPFRTANSVLLDNLKAKQSEMSRSGTSGSTKKSLGARRGPKSPFILPVPSNERADSPSTAPEASGSLYAASEPIIDERLKQFDQKVIDLIMSEIMDSKSTVTWQDIAGLEVQKKALQEVVILPMLRPDLFTGLRGPPKGLLLFGPPGTGKTLIGKCIASQSKSTFFCISASSLTSKWVGEGEKMVRALFAIGRIHQPAVIFIDEVDSLLTQRSETEHESSRRIKTEFLVQLDGVATGEEERLLFVGATNRPQELDEAARRRFVKRLYIPLPDENARQQIVRHLLSQQLNSLRDEEYTYIAEHTDGYSGADMANLCREAAMGPIRSLSIEALQSIQADQVRPVELTDFEVALRQVRPSVSPRDLEQYRKWNKQYGSFDV